MKEEHREDAKRIGRNILNLLIDSGKEQKDLARALDVSEGTVSLWINGKRIPRMGTVTRICKYFGVPKSAVIGDVGEGYGSEFKKRVLEIVNENQPQYYEDETVQIVTDRLRRNPEYSVLFKASANVKPEDIDIVTKLIEKFSD